MKALVKAPNSNVQAPEKFQAPNFKLTGIWSLGFGVCSFSGAWMLVLGAFLPAQ
jgi:hypothetical protein